MRAGRAVPMPIGYADMRRRTTPKSEMSSRISPPYSVGNGMSLVLSAVRVEMLSVPRANWISASRWLLSEQRASSLPLLSQCTTNWAARWRAHSSLTRPGRRAPGVECRVAISRRRIPRCFHWTKVKTTPKSPVCMIDSAIIPGTRKST